MADGIVFNQVDLHAWERACRREGELRRSGASELVLKAAKMDVITTMLTLMAPHMTELDLGRVLLATVMSFHMPYPDQDVGEPDSFADTATEGSVGEDTDIPD